MRHTKVHAFYSQGYFLCRTLFRISLFTFARSFNLFYSLHNCINTDLCDVFRGFETEKKAGAEHSYSGTQLIRSTTGHKNLAVLTGWLYLRGSLN